MKLFDNFAVRAFIFFLPFTYALTINIGFPLKISEVALFALFPLAFYFKKIQVPLRDSSFQVYTLFLLVSLVSLIINIAWPYDYKLSTYPSRFGYAFDSIMKFFYMVLALVAFIVSANAFYSNENRYIKIFLLGGIVAALYSWYLFASGLLHISPYLLPGIDAPQEIGLSFGSFVRSGTFKEGNYMGLFLLFCIILSFYVKRFRLGYFFMATMLTTFSTIGLVCAVLFLAGYQVKTGFTRRRLVNMLAIFTILVVGFLLLLNNQDFKVYVVSKFTGLFKEQSGGFNNVGEYSKRDRLNTTSIAFRIGMHNPVFGVGISNFARHYDAYNTDPRFVNTGKSIANNVYLELFSEIGIPGLATFLFLLFLLYRKTRFDSTGSIRPGFLATTVYFIAFPTFSILYVWVFFGFIASLPAKFQQSSTQ